MAPRIPPQLPKPVVTLPPASPPTPPPLQQRKTGPADTYQPAPSGQPGTTAQPVTTAQPAGGVQNVIPPEVTAFLNEVAAGDADLKPEFTEIRTALGKGDYQAALGALKKADRYKDLSNVDDRLKALEPQLEFLAKLQAAGVRADYPPTEGQLVDYFRTLRSNPNAARAAFTEYAKAFHAHPANDGKGLNADIVYSPDAQPTRGVRTSSPDAWSELTSAARPSLKQNMAKQLNDCEGYAFMAEKLFKAAGFTLVNQLAVAPSKDTPAHAMALFKHPGEAQYTVASNSGTYTSNSPKTAAVDAYAHAMGRTYDATGKMTDKGRATGREDIFTGPTMKDATANMVNGDSKMPG